jgi:hypothetical protein
MEKTENLEFRVHTPCLLKEIADCSLPKTAGVLKIPLNQLRILLIKVAKRASQINDPKLNALMCMLTLYDISDPLSEGYDPELVSNIMDKAEKETR